MNPVKSNYFQFNKAAIKQKEEKKAAEKFAEAFFFVFFFFFFLPSQKELKGKKKASGKRETTFFCLITLSPRFKHSIQRQTKDEANLQSFAHGDAFTLLTFKCAIFQHKQVDYVAWMSFERKKEKKTSFERLLAKSFAFTSGHAIFMSLVLAWQ